MNKLRTTPLACNGDPWFPIDNASNLYCASRRASWCRTFRFALVLREKVDPALLQQALCDLTVRMPTFCAKMQDGLFWSYFERAGKPKVHAENAFPCRPILLKRGEEPDFRVQYSGRRISLEVFHGVTDGMGALTFLTALAARYYELHGETLSPCPDLPRAYEEATEEETGDAYLLHGNDPKAAAEKPKQDVYYEKPRWDRTYLRVIHGVMNLKQLKETAAKHALTLTEYLSAVLILSFLKTADKPIEKPIRISIPINLRSRFGTKSHRNFVFMQPVSFDPSGFETIDFDAICDQIRGQLKELTTPEFLKKEISANVNAQTNPVLRLIPYPFKRLFLKKAYRNSQELFTSFISNVGEVQAPPEVLRHIERAEFVLGDTPYQPFGCGVVSVGGKLTFSFSDCGGSKQKQQFFFRFLAEDGVDVWIETNEGMR